MITPSGCLLLLERHQEAQERQLGRHAGGRAHHRALHPRDVHEPHHEPGPLGQVPQQGRMHNLNDVMVANKLQGGPSGCTLPFVDIKTKVRSQYKPHILKRNFQFDVNKK